MRHERKLLQERVKQFHGHQHWEVFKDDTAEKVLAAWATGYCLSDSRTSGWEVDGQTGLLSLLLCGFWVRGRPVLPHVTALTCVSAPVVSPSSTCWHGVKVRQSLGPPLGPSGFSHRQGLAEKWTGIQWCWLGWDGWWENGSVLTSLQLSWNKGSGHQGKEVMDASGHWLEYCLFCQLLCYETHDFH